MTLYNFSLTLKGPLVDSLQNGGHTEEGEGEVEGPVGDVRGAGVSTVLLDEFVLRRDAQASQVQPQ